LFEFTVYSTNKKSVVIQIHVQIIVRWKKDKVIIEIENTDKLQKSFIDIAAHELRTSIQTISGLICLLKSKKVWWLKKR